MARNILGIHLGHDASAAVIRDGQVVAAVEEERLTRIKGFAGFPYGAIREALSIAGVTPKDVGIVAVAGKHLHRELAHWLLLKRLHRLSSWQELYYKGMMFLAYTLNSDVVRESLYPKELFWQSLYKELQRLGFTRASFRTYDHHLCHASSAYFTSPFDKAMVFTMDACGDFCSAMALVGEGGHLKAISRLSHLDSIGQFYAAVTRFLGYRPNRHEGKVTGLAAFGNVEPLASRFRGLVHFDNGNKRAKAFRRHLPGMANPPGKTGLVALNGRVGLKKRVVIASNGVKNLPYEVAAEVFQMWLGQICSGYSREDIAAAAQKVTEEWIAEWVRRNLPAGEHDVCLAGGVFSNVKINQRIRELPGVKNVYVQPAMGDDGLSLGAALLALKELSLSSDGERAVSLDHVYLGPSYSDQEIEKTLLSYQRRFRWERMDDIEARIAELVFRGTIVGRFNGALEWGPRALGNRSILVRPTDKSINETLNKRLRRSEFMPFAPSVLDYRAKDYFIGYENDQIAADFMTITYDVYPKRQNEIEAVVHVDGTARPQVVRRETNPSFYRILQEYEKLSGLGLMVNTSFNIHEEPIVATPEDALRALEEQAVDLLAIGFFLVYPY